MPFSMPMFRSFVPERIRPWMYVFIAFTFQFSGGLYLGTLNQMMGETLFRMKFRFTNKTLLCGAATGVLLCNLTAPHITFLPLLWLVCFIEGMCKIQGTFECMSNIQLWMTPTRDFTVFFPMLHIVILGSMQLSDLLATYLMYYYHWDYMQWFICGIMMIDLLILTVCTRHFRMFKKFPLFGMRHHDDRLTDIDRLHPSFPYVQEVSFVWHRLAGSCALGGTCIGDYLRFQLW